MGVCVSSDSTSSQAPSPQSSYNRDSCPNPFVKAPLPSDESCTHLEVGLSKQNIQHQEPNFASTSQSVAPDSKDETNRNSTNRAVVNGSPKKANYSSSAISEQIPNNIVTLGSISQQPIGRPKHVLLAGEAPSSGTVNSSTPVVGGRGHYQHLKGAQPTVGLQTSNNPNSMTEEGTIPALTEDNSQNNSVLISGVVPFDAYGATSKSYMNPSFRGDVVLQSTIDSELSFSGDSDLYVATKLIKMTYDAIKEPDDSSSMNVAKPTSNGIHQAWKPLRFPEVVRAHRMRVKAANEAVNTLTLLGQGCRSHGYAHPRNRDDSQMQASTSSAVITVRRPTSIAPHSSDGPNRASSVGNTSTHNLGTSHNGGPSPLGNTSTAGSGNRLLGLPRSPLDRPHNGEDISRTSSNVGPRSANASMVLGATAVEEYGQQLLAMQRPREYSAAVSHMPSFMSRQQTFSADDDDEEGRLRDAAEESGSPNTHFTPNYSSSPLDGEEATRNFYARLQGQRKSIGRPSSRAVVTLMGADNSDDNAISHQRVLSSDMTTPGISTGGNETRLKPPRAPSSNPTPHMSPNVSMPLGARFVDSPVHSPFITPLKKTEVEDERPIDLNWDRPAVVAKGKVDSDSDVDDQGKGAVPLGPARGPDLVINTQRGKHSSGSDVMVIHNAYGSASALVTLVPQHPNKPTEPQFGSHDADPRKGVLGFGEPPTDFVAFPSSRRNTPQSHVLMNGIGGMPEANTSNVSDAPAVTTTQQTAVTTTRRRKSRLSVFARDDNGEDKVLSPHPPPVPHTSSTSGITTNGRPSARNSREEDISHPVNAGVPITPGGASLNLRSSSFDSSKLHESNPSGHVTLMSDEDHSPLTKRPSTDSPAIASIPLNRRPSLQRPQRSLMSSGLVAGAATVTIGSGVPPSSGPSLLVQRRTSAINGAVLMDKRFGDALRARLQHSENERRDAVEMAELDAEEERRGTD